MIRASAETERRFERASEFEHPKFPSEPSEFRAYLNLISIPIAETERRFERASEFEHPNFRASRASFEQYFAWSQHYNKMVLLQ